MNILVIGNGVYVTGRGTNGFGTVLPALCEWKRRGMYLGKVFIVGTNPYGVEEAKKKLKELSMLMGVDLDVRFFPEGPEIDVECYKDALGKIPDPACAIVAVPDHLHREVTGRCLEGGFHALVVKPLTPTICQAKELIALLGKRQLYGATEFHKRFDRANLKLKETITKGIIGEPLYFIVEYSQRKSIPSKTFSAWFSRSNVFQYLGVHYVDIIYFVTGGLPRKVQVTAQYGWLREQGIDTFDAIHATIEWELPNKKKFFSFIHTNWIDPENTSAMSDQQIKVIGTKGRFESDQKRRGITIVSDEKGIEELNPDFCLTYPTPEGYTSYQGYGIESIHTFLKDVSLLNKREVTPEVLEGMRPSFKESLVSTAVVEAVNNGLNQQNRWIDIDL